MDLHKGRQSINRGATRTTSFRCSASGSPEGAGAGAGAEAGSADCETAAAEAGS